MLAPKIHDSTFGKSVMLAISSQVFVQPSSASREGSTVATPECSACRMVSLIQSTCDSMLGGRLVNGPFGPRIMNRLGKPCVDRPR